MSTLKEANLRSWYTSGRYDLVRDFYAPCLELSNSYDRAAGYFRSTIFAIAGLAFVDFIERNGRLRLICSPDLSNQDVEAIHRGSALTKQIDEALIRELRTLVAQQDGRIGVEFLATLLSAGALEIKIAYRPGSRGIFHSKMGVFSSPDGAQVGFMGSSNESAAAILREWNHESFAVFTSWRGEADAERVLEMSEYFESLWNSEELELEVRPLPEVPREEIEKHRNPEGLEAAAVNIRQALAPSHSSSPSSWQPKQMLAHQSTSVAHWEEVGHRGIVKHATGAGKTLTALEAVRRWIWPGRSAIIFVPSELLLTQWREEVRDELRDVNPELLVVGGSHASVQWERDLPDFTRNAVFLGPRVVLTTMQSGSTERFLDKVVSGSHLLLVADEVHRIGSPQHRTILTIRSGGRLGLSATPERFGDPEGTRAIFEYFGDILKPEFGIPDAIKAGRLVPYDYQIHVVELNEEEQQRWNHMTERIKQIYARLPEDVGGRKTPSQEYKMLLIRRAAILKRAVRKTELAGDILQREYKPGDRWLVYCDESSQLNAVLKRMQDVGLPAYEYRSEMTSARPETLEYFERQGGILVAIRCLDEGVDIPTVNRALILASSSNPREFIQRRGRVLRRAPDKYRAVVHDALVVPADDEFSEVDPNPILRVEIARAAEFARHAQNRAVVHRLREVANQFGTESITDNMNDYEDESYE